MVDLPDFTGQSLVMGHLLALLGSNTECPEKNDVIIILETCSMGMTIRRDHRVRATGEIVINGLPQVCTDATDRRSHLILANLRRCGIVPHTWIYVE